MVSMPAECNPRACPESSPGVRATSRSCCTRLAPNPADATSTSAAATGTGGRRQKSRYGPARSSSSGTQSRARR
ncbi:hypothetical protein SGLAM104S_04000 [Streptomyces glaucescens]